MAGIAEGELLLIVAGDEDDEKIYSARERPNKH